MSSRPSAPMDKTYDPASVEHRLYEAWEKEGHFRPQKDEKGRDPYVIVIPPPNVTGILHMGHVLNNTLQDILIRWKRMQGFETLWVPGSDHAGIATQNVVAKKLREAGQDPREMGREAFLEKAWEWKDKYQTRIMGQLRRLGCSLDWERERFTLDEGLSRAVQKVFIDLYNEGLVYKGQYIVNWDPLYGTALSDEEVEFREVEGKLWHFRYPMEEGDGYLVVATTRPETMLGDTAVAMNPSDESKAAYRGKHCRLPIMDRIIPLIEDDFVDPEFGTGFVKVTPAHDPNDFDMGERHDLERIVVIGPDGSMNANAGRFEGMDRKEAREAIVEEMQSLGLVEKIEDYTHSVGHGDRSGVPIEPYLSEQWFVKMKPLAEKAIEVVKSGEVTLTPPRWEKTYMHWMENIRDWCISRQLWWGHRIPVWTCSNTGETKACIDSPGDCWVQEQDVLDTWFSSWLWPFSVHDWPEDNETLRKYYPSNDLITAPEILFFWVARMIMAGLRFADGIPFDRVFLHGIIRDKKGRKMSKSLGNSPDPLVLFDEYGVDAVRFSMTMLTPWGGDLHFENSQMEMGRNFANKLWNASRYVIGQLEEALASRSGEARDARETWMAEDWTNPGSLGEPAPEDRWILSRLARTQAEVNRDLEAFRFNDAARKLYDFLWKEYCDWYLELTKPRVYGEDEEAKRAALLTAGAVLQSTLRLLHPIAPYVTEALWERFPETEGRVITAAWPDLPDSFLDEKAEVELAYWMELIQAIRNLRAEARLKPGQRIHMIFRTESRQKDVEACRIFLESLAKVESFEFQPLGEEKPSPASSAFLEGLEIWLPLEGLVDLEEEAARLRKELGRAEGSLTGLEKKLSSEGFLAKAPEEVVADVREKAGLAKEQVEKLLASLASLGGDA
ncbi:MAG: valine--tRNA ligase [Candidatus Krumholzibacteria bacterium]|nr:valine--tRNA ligase [Candidatus Krumholzibacteria bacterium]